MNFDLLRLQDTAIRGECVLFSKYKNLTMYINGGKYLFFFFFKLTRKMFSDHLENCALLERKNLFYKLTRSKLTKNTINFYNLWQRLLKNLFQFFYKNFFLVKRLFIIDSVMKLVF